MTEEREKSEKAPQSFKGQLGGYRPGSGRKPLLNKEDILRVKELIAQHGSEFDEKSKKERLLVMMDMLYKEGTKGNIMAAKEYMDRMMGRARQTIGLDGGSEDKPIAILTHVRSNNSNKEDIEA